MNKQMMKALKADGRKLKQLTGKDHGPFETADADLFETPEEIAEWMLTGKLPDRKPGEDTK
jgi:hypothetical protein